MSAKMKTLEEQHQDYQRHIAVLKESLCAKEEHYNMLQADVSKVHHSPQEVYIPIIFFIRQSYNAPLPSYSDLHWFPSFFYTTFFNANNQKPNPNPLSSTCINLHTLVKISESIHRIKLIFIVFSTQRLKKKKSCTFYILWSGPQMHFPQNTYSFQVVTACSNFADCSNSTRNSCRGPIAHPALNNCYIFLITSLILIIS